MSDDVLKKAYQAMQELYLIWEKKPRPDAPWSTSHLFEHPILVSELGFFREEEWVAYVRARDTYLDLAKRGIVH